MKTTSIFLLLIFSFFVLHAQEKAELTAQQKFVGVWQLCTVTAKDIKFDQTTGKILIDTTNIQTRQIHKIFGQGGEFTALAVSSIVSVVTIAGTYEVESDKYIENVGFHSNPNYANRRIELPYEFIGDNFFMMNYKTPAGTIAAEVWKRVKQGNISTETMKMIEKGAGEAKPENSLISQR
jgi:hypothetical protein